MNQSLSKMLLACTALAATGLSGCGAGMVANIADSTPGIVAVKPVQGAVMGGQFPVANVTLQLYQAGTGGYGSAALLLGPTTQTNANGQFNLPAYSCAAGSQVYMVGTGGQPTPTLTNNNLALMVGLGTCGGTDLNGFINMNELTTVATVWALSPFMTGPANIGSPASNTTGLANAFAVINEVVNTANGNIPGPSLPAGAVLPTQEINTLGDILAQCVNSGGGVAGDSSNCGNLFNLAPNAAGTVFPTDTITAAMNIAQSPGRNFTALNRLNSGSDVFQPALNVNAPQSAWTIAISYSGGGLSAPSSIATDANGAVWVSNSGNASVTQLDIYGAALSSSSGFSAGVTGAAPAAIAVDTSGHVWVANSGNNSVAELSTLGSSIGIYTGNGLNAPGSIAIDGTGNVWIANTGSSGTGTLSAFTNNGTAIANYSGAGSNAPVSIAVTPK